MVVEEEEEEEPRAKDLEGESIYENVKKLTQIHSKPAHAATAAGAANDDDIIVTSPHSGESQNREEMEKICDQQAEVEEDIYEDPGACYPVDQVEEIYDDASVMNHISKTGTGAYEADAEDLYEDTDMVVRDQLNTAAEELYEDVASAMDLYNGGNTYKDTSATNSDAGTKRMLYNNNSSRNTAESSQEPTYDSANHFISAKADSRTSLTDSVRKQYSQYNPQDSGSDIDAGVWQPADQRSTQVEAVEEVYEDVASSHGPTSSCSFQSNRGAQQTAMGKGQASPSTHQPGEDSRVRSLCQDVQHHHQTWTVAATATTATRTATATAGI